MLYQSENYTPDFNIIDRSLRLAGLFPRLIPNTLALSAESMKAAESPSDLLQLNWMALTGMTLCIGLSPYLAVINQTLKVMIMYVGLTSFHTSIDSSIAHMFIARSSDKQAKLYFSFSPEAIF